MIIRIHIRASIQVLFDGFNVSCLGINSKELDPLHGQLFRTKESLPALAGNISGYTPPCVTVIDYFFYLHPLTIR